MTTTQQPSPDITLSTGSVIRHTRLEDGAEFAVIVGRESDAMSAEEWDEYCEMARARAAASASRRNDK